MLVENINPYVPFALKFLSKKHFNKYGERSELILNGLSLVENNTWQYEFIPQNESSDLYFAKLDEKDFQPILKPMKNLDSYFSKLFDDDIDVRTFMNKEFLESRGIETFDQLYEFKAEWLPFGLVNLLLKHHFDIFDLIKHGFAIDEGSLSLVS
jgi:hypothetical protein